MPVVNYSNNNDILYTLRYDTTYRYPVGAWLFINNAGEISPDTRCSIGPIGRVYHSPNISHHKLGIKLNKDFKNESI